MAARHQPDLPGVSPSPAAPAPATPAPTPARERIEILDVLRGLALYGVLLANTVQFFSGRAFLPREQVIAHTSAIDRAFLTLVNIFVDGKAMALLTLLFGLGFSLQLQRAEARGRSVAPTYLRRLAALALIGCCHVLLLWWGDILWGYAIAGMGLLLFRRVRPRPLLCWGIALALLPNLVASVPWVARVLAPILPHPADLPAFRARLLAAITGHDRLALTAMHVRQAYYHVGRFWVPYPFWLLGHFLIGYWAGTARLFQDVARHLRFFRRLAAWALPLGLAASAVPAVHRLLSQPGVRPPERIWRLLSVPSEVGTLVLACGYAAAVVLLMQRPAARRALTGLAPVGQMALTTYLCQSLVCTFLFYGWGLGLTARVQPAGLLPITLTIFIFQALFARAWLARFRFGPMEWVWRSLTYGRLPPMRRPGTVS